MGTAYLIIDYEKIDTIYDSEYVMDVEGKVIEEIENMGATEIKKEKFPTRISFTYSDTNVVEDVKRYAAEKRFLLFVKEFVRKDSEIY